MKDEREQRHAESVADVLSGRALGSKLRQNGGTVLLGLLAATAVVQVGAIVWLRWHPTDRGASATPRVRVGQQFAPLKLLDLSGRPVLLDPAALAGCTSLIFFAPTCPYCTESAPYWRSDFYPAGQRRAIGIALTTPDSAQAYAEKHSLRFPIFSQRGDGAELTRATGVLSVPNVVQLAPGGTVKRVIRGGPYDRAELDSLDTC